MNNTEINIITKKGETSIIEVFKEELETVRFENYNYLLEKELLIDGSDYFFYPIIIDTEIEVNGGIFLIGFYLPFSNKYFSFIFDKNDHIDYLEWVKVELINIFNMFKENHFTNYSNKSNCKVYPILVGHNIIKYDFIILFDFLYINKNLNKSYINAERLSDIIINSEQANKYPIHNEARKCVYKQIKTFFCLDTLLCVNLGEVRSLFKFKVDIYFNSDNEQIPPLEFDLNNKVLKNNKEAIKHLCKYNLNDLYYNYRCIFYDMPKVRIKSRCLLYKNLAPKTVGFSQSINQFDSATNSLYIIEKSNIDRKPDFFTLQRIKVGLNDIHFLNKYYFLDDYIKYFKDKNLYKLKNENNGKINIKNITANMGIGGLHSETMKIGARNNPDYNGTQLIFASSNDEHLTIMLDFQSFYINIVLQLLNHINTYSNERDIIKELNEIRLKLKKNKDPNDIIFKLSTLAYTGSLNDPKSKVFLPELYLSMTLNGQLLCLELLHFLEKHIEKIIEINTDGLVIYIKKKNFENIMLLCDQFEKKYDFKIDTREIIKCGLFFSANRKIFVDQNSKVTIKGFRKGLAFGFLPQTLAHWITNNTNLFENFNNSEQYKNKLYISLWKSFNSQIAKDKINKNIKNYLNAETVSKNKLIIYFSKTPSHFGGAPSATKVILAPYPIKTLDFKVEQKNNNIKSNIMKDLDIATYWTYFMDKLSPYFIYNIKNKFEEIKPIVLNNNFEYLYKNKKMNLPLFYLNNKKLIFYFNKLSILGFVVFMKDRDKKSFPKTKMIQSGLVNQLNSNRKTYYKYMLEKHTYGMVNGVAICANLKESWENGICCIDFDGVEWFFREENFDERSNLKKKAFLYFILRIKNTGFLIYSSMTNSPFDRFKIFFKITHKPISLSYKEFQKIHKNHCLNFDFNVEEVSSIVGSNLYGQKLLNTGDFEELQEIDFKSYNDFFIDEEKSLLNFDENIKFIKYKDLLIQLFDERCNEQRVLYNNLIDKKDKLNYFDYNKYKINKIIFIKIFTSIIEKENFNKLDLYDTDSIFYFYKFNYGPLEIKNNKTPGTHLESKLYNKDSKNLKKIIVNKVENFVKPTNTFVKSIQELKFDKYAVDFNNINNVINIIDEIFDYFNNKYNTTFIYSEMTNNEIIYHSNCIFKNDNNNNKQVTCYINCYFQCYITCYHNSCKITKKYKKIETLINENLYSIVLSYCSEPFTKVNKNFNEILDLYS